MKNINFFGIIPARSGSESVKNKNIKLLNGKPLIYWTIKAAKESKMLNDFIVSTNSEKISKIAKSFGAPIPYLRPNNLAKSDTTMISVVKNVLENIKNIKDYDAIVLLPPTTPLRTSVDIDKACKLFIKNKPDSLIGVTEVKHTNNPNSLFNLKEKNYMEYVYNVKKIYQKQNKKKYYASNSSIYITKLSKSKKYIIGGKMTGYLMSILKSIDIDSIEEFILAESLMKYNS